MSSVLWCVMKGRAMAPPAMGCIIGRLHLDVAARVEEAPDLRHHGAAGHEGGPHLRAHHEVHVALAVTRLHVGEAVPLLRRRQQRLGEEVQLGGLHRQLALARAHHVAGDAQVVAAVHQVEHPVGRFPHVVLPHVDLQLGAAVGQRGEGGLAVRPLQHDPAGDARGRLERVQRLHRLVAVGGGDLGQPVRALEARRVERDAPRPERAPLLQPLRGLFRPALGQRSAGLVFAAAHPSLLLMPLEPETLAPGSPDASAGRRAPRAPRA